MSLIQCSLFRILILLFLEPRKSLMSFTPYFLIVLILVHGGLFVSFRRLKKLKDAFVRARLPKPSQVLRPRGMHPCRKSRYQICKFVSCLDTFRNTFYNNYNFDCDSSGAFYLLTYKSAINTINSFHNS